MFAWDKYLLVSTINLPWIEDMKCNNLFFSSDYLKYKLQVL